MKTENWKQIWLQEARRTFTGWDFSSLSGRMEEEKLPWDYEAAVKSYMGQNKGNLLDMGTGGGELLLSLSPPRNRTYATEAYPPNVELCRGRFPSHGIELRQVFSDEALPFEDGFFSLVINRHESFSVREVHRILQPGGVFITQQVGGQNNRALSEFLLGDEAAAADEAFSLEPVCAELRSSGFTVLEADEAYPVLRFRDIGALVYFATIIEWEFPGFTVEKCYEKLCMLQDMLIQEGALESTEHRFMIIAVKQPDYLREEPH
ncbi:SAM-dependent methyltransferase [Paenibacillus sp. PK3_47]|uniref:class I SAM-dependent methyltransferase n=1 Tax=Paenibacillus sp. PK3_47 TaxID=2072642 RepID=UPI00201E28F6|nr:class I SAM-dependent methyltransferase [Paenibacillus sp. PK3_47]UQZ34057.1 SAM-dependent methyltransferase [Paenibacillus sp. PK3_47]